MRMPCLQTLQRLACSLLLAGAAAAHADAPGEPAAGLLPPAVAQALLQAGVPPQALAVVVQPVADGAPPPAPRLRLNAAQPMNPASLFKLVTTAAALDLLGPAYSWRTPVWLDGPVHDGRLEGALVIQGSGDPTLVLERVWLLLRQVRQHGVRRIDGDIVLDRSLFVPPAGTPADFDGEPLRPYNVQPDALLLNHKAVRYSFRPEPALGIAHVSAEPPLAGVAVDTSVALADGPCEDWRSRLAAAFTEVAARFAGRYPASCGEREWPVAYPAPAQYNARLLQALWREAGGELAGSVRDDSAPAATPPSLVFTSPPLADVVRDINKYSNNVMAQQLFLTLGALGAGSGSPEAARHVLHEWLAQRFGAGAAAATVIDNGSGLSRDTRLSADLLAQLLQASHAGPTMPELASSLPVSGLDGTLRRTTAPTGRAHLKTGSLRDVAGIAGYVLAASGRRYVLVALINHPNALAARGALDALVQWTHDDR